VVEVIHRALLIIALDNIKLAQEGEPVCEVAHEVFARIGRRVPMFASNFAHRDFAVKLFRRTIKKNPAIFRNVTPETQPEEKITP